MMPSLCAAFRPLAACWRISATSGEGKRPPLLDNLTERFAFQKLHGDVGRAVIRLARFVNGDDIGVMNATRGTRLVLKAQQEIGVIEKFAVQDLERHGAISHPNLLGEERPCPCPPLPRRRTMRKRRESPAASCASVSVAWAVREAPSRGQSEKSSG